MEYLNMLRVHEQLRIGYVLKRFPRFSETFILNELLSLQKLGVEAEIFSLLRPPEEPRHANIADLKYPVTELADIGKRISTFVSESVHSAVLPCTIDPMSRPLFSGKTEKDILALHAKAAVVAARAQASGITHLHAHFGSDATTVALLAARVLKGSFSFTAHARDIYHTYVSPAADNAMRRSKIQEAAFVTTVSNYNAEYLRKLAPEAASKIVRLYNGIDLQTFLPVNAEVQKAGRILAVGRLVEKKGFSMLVQACAELKKHDIKFECRLVGDGPLRESLQDQIGRLGLADSVFLDGALPQERLIELMDTAVLAVLPCVVTDSGDRDGLPTVLLEAMAKALPIITTTVSGGPEIVHHGVTGLLVEPGDTKALADAMQQLLSDVNSAREMGLHGRNKALLQFDLTSNVKTLRNRFLTQCKKQQPVEQIA